MKKFKLNIFVLVSSIFILGTIIYAAGIYAPGETLNPTCAPGDANCTVDVGKLGKFKDGGSGKIYYNDGNVGIGITSPVAKLHIKTTTGNDYMKFSSSGYMYKMTDQGGMSFGTDSSFILHAGDNTKNLVSDLGITATTTSESLYLTADKNVEIITNRQNDFTSSHKFIFTNSGRLGIGTTSPGAKLEVKKSGSSEQLVSFKSDNDISMELRSTHATAGEVYYELADGVNGAGNSWKIGTNDDGKLHFDYGTVGSMNGGEKMTILTNGNVGIGITSPGAKLDVNGNVFMRGTDFKIWNNNRGGSGTSSGRALVHIGSGDKASSQLYINYGGDFPAGTIIPYGNVGIGTTSPGAKLDVDGGIQTKNNLWVNGDTIRYGLSLRNSDIIGINELRWNDLGEGLKFSTGPKASDERISVYATDSNPSNFVVDTHKNGNNGKFMIQTYYGNVYIGPQNSSYMHFYTDRDKYYFNKAAYASGGFHTYSDLRLKKDISKIDNPLEKIAKIRGVYYKYKNKALSLETKDMPKGQQVGVIAQEVEKVLPEVVSTDEEGVKSVDYSKLTPLLIEAVKEQQKEIKNQQKEIDELKKENREILEKLKKIEKNN